MALVLGGIVILYQVGYHLWYGNTLLGRYPVLDGREILLLAEAMAGGHLPAEPFYRAPLYSGLLSIFYSLGLNTETVLWLSRFVNLVAHLGGATATGYLAYWFWGSTRAGWIAFLVAGVYPVTLHFAGDPLDTVFSMGLFLGSLAAMARCTSYNAKDCITKRLGWLAMAATGFVLAVAARPQFFIAAPVFIFPLWYFWQLQKKTPVAEALVLLVVCASGFGLLGAWNYKVGGEFRILPWQGPSNWYAANQPEAHGKFFVHQMELPLSAEHSNPTRRESEFIFLEESGHQGNWSIAEFNAFWNQKNSELWREQPLKIIKQMARKSVYLLHHTEQYNNKTYSFHRQRSPFLRWNPLGWAILITLAAILLPVAWQHKRAKLLPLLTAGMLLAGGTILYFVSARFRLPLVPLLTIVAAGVGVPGIFRFYLQDRQLLRSSLLCGLAGLFLSLFPWQGVHSPDTTIEDRLLLAQAADQLGELNDALYYAKAVLKEQPNRLAALEVKTNVYLNTFLLELWQNKVRPTDIVYLENNLKVAYEKETPIALWTISLIRWQQGKVSEAKNIWRNLADEESVRGRPELGALLINDSENRENWISTTERYLQDRKETPSPYLLAGLAIIDNSEAMPLLSQTFSPVETERLLLMWRELMAPPLQ